MKPASPTPAASQTPSLRLFEFSFQSLYFCRTPFNRVYAASVESTFNCEYMRLIQGGWAVPLSFVLDIARALTWRPELSDQGHLESTKYPLLTKIAAEYKQALHSIRQSPFFVQIVEKLRSVKDESKRREAVRVFIEFLVVGPKDFKKIYAFDASNVFVSGMVLTTQGIAQMQVEVAGASQPREFRLGDVDQVYNDPEFAAAAELTTQLCAFYLKTRPDDFLDKEHALLLDIAMRSDKGVRWVDLRLVQELVRARTDLDAEEVKPRPRQVERVVLTDHSVEDGTTGGYTDVQTKRFSNCAADLLPVELAVADHEDLFFHKLLNQGALHYIRENPENIEREYRILFCFVIDTHPAMDAAPRRPHSSFGKGLTASHRARDLASRMVHDLALHLPRKDVRVDFGLYLWSPGASDAAPAHNAGKQTPGASLDLFAWNPKTDRERLPFLSRLSDQAPALFHVQAGVDLVDLVVGLTEKPAKRFERFRAFDPTPARFLTSKRSFHPHSTHLVYLTSKAVPPEAQAVFGTDSRDDPKISALPYTSNSIWFVHCDVTERSVGLIRPLASWLGRGQRTEAGKEPALEEHRWVSEDQLRFWFLDTVLRKAGGKSLRSDLAVMLEKNE